MESGGSSFLDPWRAWRLLASWRFTKLRPSARQPTFGGDESMVTDLRSLEQELVDGVSTERLMEDVRFLSTLQRHSGTEDERRAAEYVRDRLAAEGIDVTIHTFRSLLSHPHSAKLELLAPERIEVPTATRAFSISVPEGVEAELVDVGSGTAADFRRVDVKGRFALADQGGPET